MITSDIYKALKQIKKETMQFQRLRLICNRLADMGLATAVTENDAIKGYKLTINGKIFIWDYENGKLTNQPTSSIKTPGKKNVLH